MTTLEILHAELLEELGSIAGVEHCSEPPKRRDQIRLPAILLDLVELEPDTDPGTGELALTSHWEARVVVSDNQSETVLWQLVQAVLLWLYNNAWSSTNIGRANIKQASPDHFSPEFQGHRIWLIEWTQLVRIGDDVWTGECIVPETIFVSINGDPHQIIE
jgi:hypothetical protein